MSIQHPDTPSARSALPNEHGSQRVSVLGCLVDNLTMEETLGRIERFIASGLPHQHVVVNVDKIVKANRDPALRKIINDCALINVDGMPVVWASRLLGCGLKERVAGVDLFDALMVRADRLGWKVYLLGARAEVVNDVKAIYERRLPGIRIVGCRDGYWPADKDSDIAAEIGASGADILFVAISSPRKEEFLGQYQRFMRVPFAMGVGGTFDVASGRVKRAPVWMQRCGLEWFYRFLQEPRRMFRRYFIEDMAFFGLLLRALMRGRG